MEHVDATIRLFAPDADLSAIKPKPYTTNFHAFRGEVARHVLSALRQAEGPISTQDMPRAVCLARGLNADDPSILKLVRNRVNVCLGKLRDQHLIREAGKAGEFKAWALA